MSIESANSASAGSGTYADSLSMDEAVNLLADDAPEPVYRANPREVAAEDEQDAEEAVYLDDEPADGFDDEFGDDSDGTADDGEGQGPVAAADDALVTLQDGSQLTVKELKEGNLRERDYRIKTSELANGRRELEAQSTRVHRTLDAFIDHLASHLPDEPDVSLAHASPGEYVQRKALFESAIQQLQQIMQYAAEPKQVGQQLTTRQHQELLAFENARLLERLPVLADPARRGEFNRAILDTAQSLGFSPEELGANIDHRFYILGHYARLGMETERAKAKAATKMKNLPPVTPTTRRSVNRSEAAVRQNQDAMARLRKSGSIKDAIQIDFD